MKESGPLRHVSTNQYAATVAYTAFGGHFTAHKQLCDIWSILLSYLILGLFVGINITVYRPLSNKLQKSSVKNKRPCGLDVLLGH